MDTLIFDIAQEMIDLSYNLSKRILVKGLKTDEDVTECLVGLNELADHMTRVRTFMSHREEGSMEWNYADESLDTFSEKMNELVSSLSKQNCKIKSK